MVDNNIEDESTAIGKEIMPLIESVDRLLAMHPMTQTTQIHPLLKLHLCKTAQEEGVETRIAY
jgi:hypothetical protein